MTVQVIQHAQCFECGKMFPWVDLRQTSRRPEILADWKEPNHCPTCFAMLFGPAAKEFSHSNAALNLMESALAG
jgi:hypothetical protein